MRPENESDQAIGILIATAANVSSWRIRLAAYVTRLERVRGSRPSWVQIPHPPPLEIPALKESGFSHFYTQNLSLKVPHWCSLPMSWPSAKTPISFCGRAHCTSLTLYSSAFFLPCRACGGAMTAHQARSGSASLSANCHKKRAYVRR